MKLPLKVFCRGRFTLSARSVKRTSNDRALSYWLYSQVEASLRVAQKSNVPQRGVGAVGRYEEKPFRTSLAVGNGDTQAIKWLF